MKIANDVLGAWKSQILFTLNELKVFETLEQGAKQVTELSSLLDLPENSLHRLLNAAVAVGYILKDGDSYCNASYIQTVMNKESKAYLGNWLQMYARWYATFSMLPQAVKKGSAIEDVNANDDEDYHRIFIKGMTDYASYRGRDILNYIDFSKVKNLLDVGCGPGIYVAMFCESYADLHCTCYDVPEALRITEDYLEKQGFLNRVTLQPGNYLSDLSFGESEYDVVFISHVLHQEDEATCAAIVKKAFNALKPEGKIIIQAMFLNNSMTGPLYASLHDLLSLMIFPGGKNYTYQETMTLLKDAGFYNVYDKRMSLFNVNSLVFGEKGTGS